MDRVRVLVVEDSEDQAQLLREYFERAGCAVTTVESAEQALVAYRDGAPHLSVIDLNLPGMNGWELAAKVKSGSLSKAIAITSVLDPSDFPPADGILPKPFTKAQVRQLLADTVPQWSAA